MIYYIRGDILENLKEKNVVMVNNNFYDCVNSFSIIEERLFFFIANKYRQLYYDIVNGGYNEKVLSHDDNNNIIKFVISKRDFINECKSLHVSINNIMNIIKILPKNIVKYKPNGMIGSLPVFDSIWFIPYAFDSENDYFEITINKTFLDVIMFNDFETGKFFKVYYDEFKKITGSNTKKLYRLVARYVNMTYYKMPIKIFKNYFSVPEVYKMTHYTRLLDRSIKELETKTKFKVTFDKEKKGRTITHINFCFNRT